MALKKVAFPVKDVRRFMEPGPIVLVSSRFKNKTNIMTMGWHMVLETTPSLLGCYIWSRNYSFDSIRRSKECVINVPDVEMARTVVKIGNTSGRDVDKFALHRLTPLEGKFVAAPLVEECHTSSSRVPSSSHRNCCR
jgi:flavin reductase (DIM6/NTAB) family NADH-FMN oxidoreductase RutF